MFGWPIRENITRASRVCGEEHTAFLERLQRFEVEITSKGTEPEIPVDNGLCKLRGGDLRQHVLDHASVNEKYM